MHSGFLCVLRASVVRRILGVGLRPAGVRGGERRSYEISLNLRSGARERKASARASGPKA